MKARKALDLLPPTRDALQLHLVRCNEQAKIWISADDPTFTAQDPLRSGGWQDEGNGLKPLWMRLEAVPSACTQLILCGCKQSAVHRIANASIQAKFACLNVLVKPKTVLIPLDLRTLLICEQ